MRSASPQNLGEGAEPRIVEAARAFHRDDGNSQRILELSSGDRSPEWQSCGPTRTSGRFASASPASTFSAAATWSGRACGTNAEGVGHRDGASSSFSSSRSNGRLRCTGPRRPDRAFRAASATSCPNAAAEPAVQDALATGAAISACRNS